jgi:SAM-dependent methyltransferase
LPARGRILEAGGGTGQISLPFAELGYEVRGVDIATEMVRVAQSKVQPTWNAQYGADDVRNLPFPNGTFDAVVVSKLFQHVQDWQGACRGLIPGAPTWSTSHQNRRERGILELRPALLLEPCRRTWIRARFLGVDPHSRGAVPAFLVRLGCQIVPVDVSGLEWKTSITYGEAIDRIRDKLFAKFWYLPEHVHDRLVAGTAAWIETQPERRDTVDHLIPRLSVEVFRTRAPAGRVAQTTRRSAP